MTCLADWAAMRPNSIGGSGSVTKSPSLAASFLALASSSSIWRPCSSTVLDDFEQAPQAQLAGLGIDLGA